MRSIHMTGARGALAGLALAFLAYSGAAAQGRYTLPAGSVILVRTTTALQSNTAQVGQTFETVVIDTVGVDNFTVIPEGSRVRGVISFVQPATSNQNGVIEVAFDRLTLTDGTQLNIAGKLTSTDPTERRQIDADPNTRVVLIGGRSRTGIAGAGLDNSPASSILVALGSLLSGGSRNVNVAPGTALAVKLEQPLALRGRGRGRADGNTIYTDADRIREAQQALARLNYFRGSANGQLDYATQRALFEYQIDKGISATGNLDWRTARALGITINDNAVGGGVGGSGGIMSVDDATALRRNAQAMLGGTREYLGITQLGRLTPNRQYSEGDFELWFALSSYADNASLFEQLIRGGSTDNSAALAGRALVSAARRVDQAMQRTRVPTQVQNAWSQTRSQISSLDASYR